MCFFSTGPFSDPANSISECVMTAKWSLFRAPESLPSVSETSNWGGGGGGGGGRSKGMDVEGKANVPLKTACTVSW